MSVESGTGGAADGGGVAAELAQLRDALEDLRRRPVPLDVDTLRHVFTASFSEATAPPPNLLVTAIRRLDRVDARLESIEALLGGPAGLPRGTSQATAAPAGSAAVPAPESVPAQYLAPPDPEAIAEALARRLAAVLSAPAPAGPGPAGPTVGDLMVAVRPLVPEAARAVLRRAGREPSPQAVEVLQQTALSVLEAATDSLDASAAPGAVPAAPVEGRRVARPPALVPAPPPPPPAAAPPEPLDVDALALRIAARVADAVVAALPAAAPPRLPPPRVEAPVRPADPQEPLRPTIDPSVVADVVISRLAQLPPPQAVLSPMAMAPLLSAVAHVESAVARLAQPEADVVVAVNRLEAGVEALARALEEDRSLQVEEVRRGFTEVNDLLRAELAAPTHSSVVGAAPDPPNPSPSGESDRRLDRLGEQPAPLAESDLAAVAELSAQNQRLERSLTEILTALAGLAEHRHEQAAAWRSGSADLAPASVPAGNQPSGPTDLTSLHQDLSRLVERINELAAGTAADRQRFQRLGGTIDGLAELLGQVSERLDRLPRDRPPEARSSAAGLAEEPVGDASLPSDGEHAEPGAGTVAHQLAPADQDDQHGEDAEAPEARAGAVATDAADAEDGASRSPGRRQSRRERRRSRLGYRGA